MRGGRIATEADVDALTETLVRAFYEDPVWSWAFADPEGRLEHYRVVWRPIVESSIECGCAWLTPGAGAAALWIAPGQTELRPEDEKAVEARLEELMGDGAARVLETMERFDAAHPQDPEHYYLSLLGTLPERQGQGEGLGLLAESLAWIDERGAPAYLESTNPGNDRRYERHGFLKRDSFELGEDGPSVTQMWRQPQPAG